MREAVEALLLGTVGLRRRCPEPVNVRFLAQALNGPTIRAVLERAAERLLNEPEHSRAALVLADSHSRWGILIARRQELLQRLARCDAESSPT